ncbi:MAG: O-methyltransferase [Armatimonadota bacterium]|nr:O-methyltransferase [Armatimonadota bacterium]MDW8155536.1 O-methyltransferase [Armatimonadota bacterium]
MDLFHARLMPYLESLVPPRHPVMEEMEARARATGFPIVGPAVGQLFYVLTRLAGAHRVFEMGSGFGYSTAWFALAVRDNGGGEVHHVVWDAQLSRDARGYLDRMGLLPVVRFHVAEAVAQLASMDATFDVVFNDIEKPAYPAALPVIKARLRPGGLLLADNVLWYGRVLDRRARDEATEAIRAFTRAVSEDPEFAATVVPLRDGVLVAYRR